MQFGSFFMCIRVVYTGMSTGLQGETQLFREICLDSPVGIVTIDPAGTIVFSNGFLESYLGLESEAVRERHISSICENSRIVDTLRDAAETGATVELDCTDIDGETVRLSATCVGIEGEQSRYFTLYCRKQSGGSTSGTATATGHDDVSFPVEELVPVVADLFSAETVDAVVETGLQTAERVLQTDIACLRLFDETTNAFEDAHCTERAAILVESYPAFDLHRTLAGRAFRRNEPVIDRPEPGVDSEIERTNVHLPLDGRGVLTLFDSGTPFSDGEIEVANDVATLIADRLGQIESPEHGRERAGVPVQSMVTDAIEAGTREEMGRRLCERLVGMDSYSGAWFVTTEIDGAWRGIEAKAGETDASPETVRRAITSEGDSEDWVTRAIEKNEPCVVQHTVLDGTDDRQDRVRETTLVVPVSHVDRSYGVLVLHADEHFESGRRSELETLRDLTGLAVYAVEQKNRLLSEKVQQLEFEVTDRSCLAVAVSDAVGSFCEIEHQTMTNDGNYLCFMYVEETDPGAAVEATTELGSVANCTVIDTRDGGCLLEVTKRQSGAEAMMDVGATVEHATADDGVGTLIVNAPLSADVREVVDAYTELNPDSRLVAKREINSPTATMDSLIEGVDDVLTEKQQSTMTTAYYSGYFEWPRAKTAEEVADSLDISPATFHQHLRAAERSLLSLVCDEQAHLRDQ